MITYGDDPSDLYSALARKSDDVVLLVGAAVSGLAPTSVPAATPAVRACLTVLFEKLGEHFNASRHLFEEAPQFLSEPDAATARLRIPLETLLEALDAYNSAGVKIAESLDLCAGSYNALHVELAARVDAGNYVLTTNFDESIERAGNLDPALRWTADGSEIGQARLIKLHGTASDPASLRHTLRRVDRRFPQDEVDAIRAITSRTMIILGYEGADYDVIDLLSDTGDCVYWLQLRGRPVPSGARRLGRTRDVRVVEGNLVDLALDFLGDTTWYEGGHNARFEESVASTLNDMPADTVVDILSPLVFEASAAFSECAHIADRLLSVLHNSRYTRAYLSLAAAQARHHTRPMNTARAAVLQLRLSALAPTTAERWRHVSDAADALDGWFYGQGPIWRRLSLSIHSTAARHVPEAGWLWFRAARSARAGGNWIMVTDLLKRSMQHDLNTSELAHCHRMMALACAGRGLPYEQHLERARELFDFGAKTQASADLLRTAAGCALLSDDLETAKRLLVDAISEHLRNDQTPGVVQSALLLAMIELSPRIARRLMLI